MASAPRRKSTETFNVASPLYDQEQVSQKELDLHTTLYTGPMFSGKTASLRSDINNCALARFSFIYIEYRKQMRNGDSGDDDSDSAFAIRKVGNSHNNDTNGIETCVAVNKLSDVPPDMLERASVIGIDEAQLFTDIAVFVAHWQRSKVMLMAGLMRGFQRQWLGNMDLVVPMCDGIVDKKGVCHTCGSFSGSMTGKIGGDMHQSIDLTTANYVCLCPRCYYQQYPGF